MKLLMLLSGLAKAEASIAKSRSSKPVIPWLVRTNSHS